MNIDLFFSLDRYSSRDKFASFSGDCAYVISDIDDNVLYVGRTSNLSTRMRSHKNDKFKGVDFFYRFIASNDSACLEYQLIRDLNPSENIIMEYQSGADGAVRFMGFSGIDELAKMAGLSVGTLVGIFKDDRNRFDDLLIGAKNKLNLAQIDFYRECAKEDGVTFEQWYKNKDSI